MMVVRWWHCCIVEWAFLKPNWWDGNQSWDLVSLSILCSRSFSYISDMTDNRLIGLYEVTSVGCFPGFRIMITLACLSVVGQYSSISITLYNCRRVCCPLEGSSWIIWAVIWSGPGALDLHSFLMIWFNSEALHERILVWLLSWLASMFSTSGWGYYSEGYRPLLGGSWRAWFFPYHFWPMVPVAWCFS